MSDKASARTLYDKSLLVRYKIFVNFFLYPWGIRDFIFRKIPIAGYATILDAGCGYGILSKAIRDKVTRERLRGVVQHAFDISPDMVEASRKKCGNGIKLRQLDVSQLSYQRDSFDLIVSAAMLEYVPDIENALLSLKRCLKPSGRMYIFMSRKSPLNDFLFLPFGKPRCYSFHELEDILKRCGFRETRRHRFPPRFCWLNVWGVIISASK